MSYTFPLKDYDVAPDRFQQLLLQVSSFIEDVAAAPAAAHWLGAITLVAWYLKGLFLNGYLENRSGLKPLSLIAEGLFSAIVAGYVFFIIFAYLPEVRQRRKLAAFFCRNVGNIVGDCQAIMGAVANATGRNLVFNTEKPPSISAAFTALPMSSPAPMVYMLPSGILTHVTWLAFFTDRQERTQQSIAELYAQSRFIDVELVAILTDVSKNTFFMQNRAIVSSGAPINNPNLGIWGPSFFQYMVICRRLVVWYNANRPRGVAAI